MQRFSIASVSVVVSVLGALAFIALQKQDQPTPSSAARLNSGSAPYTPTPSIQPDTNATEIKPITKPELQTTLRAPNPVREEWLRSDNLAQFVRTALTRPTESGTFYALLAVDDCGSVNSTYAQFESTPKSAAQRASYDRIRSAVERCKRLTEQYSDLGALLKSARDTRMGVDPLLHGEFNIFSGLNPKVSEQRALQLIRERENPDEQSQATQIFAERFIVEAFKLEKPLHPQIGEWAMGAASVYFSGQYLNQRYLDRICLTFNQCDFPTFDAWVESQLRSIPGAVDQFNRVKQALIRHLQG
jgi:hypothetical protein